MPTPEPRGGTPELEENEKSLSEEEMSKRSPRFNENHEIDPIGDPNSLNFSPQEDNDSVIKPTEKSRRIFNNQKREEQK